VSVPVFRRPALFEPAPANLTLVRDSYQMMFSIVLNGVPGTQMPAHPTMSQQTFDGLLDFIRAQPADLSREWAYPWESELILQEKKLDPNVALVTPGSLY